ncbi:hypothetical protein [Allokutzneria oryzae]|uniref:DUF4878 domain-containing protein n=1 Tax=Allokutzneria oryzae TaxID=1378989 RepID=A0ABV5ZWL2_9PSEU
MSQPPQKTFQVNEKVKKTAIKAGKYVGIKLLKWAAFLLVLALAWWYFFGGSGGNGSDGKASNSPTRGLSPEHTLRMVYTYAEAGDGGAACSFFSTAGAEEFAKNMGAVNCLQAIDDIAAKAKTEPLAKAKVPPVPAFTSGGKSEASSCQMRENDGRRLGAFLLTRQPDGGWQITGHEAEPADCVTG